MKLSPDPIASRWLDMQRLGSARPDHTCPRLMVRGFGFWLFLTALGIALIACW